MTNLQLIKLCRSKYCGETELLGQLVVLGKLSAFQEGSRNFFEEDLICNRRISLVKLKGQFSQITKKNIKSLFGFMWSDFVSFCV